MKTMLATQEVKTEVKTVEVATAGVGTSKGLMSSNSNASTGPTNVIGTNHGSNTTTVGAPGLGGGATGGNAGNIDAGVRFHLQRMKQFTIHGGFVASGDTPIGYSNLKFQLEDGKDQGYNERELVSGVIRAIKPNSNLRQYLESCGRMSMETLLQHIKNHYSLTDSSKMLTQLAGSVQGKTQKVQDFIAQLGRLRNDIITISQEEGNPLDPEMVRKRFLHAISVGVRKNTIRLEIQALLKNTEITDEELGAEVQKIATREEEHEAKMGEQNIKSNALNVGEANSEKLVLAELARISARMNEIAATKSDEVLALR